MSESKMEYVKNEGSGPFRIDFHIKIDGDLVTSQLQYIILLKASFGGKLEQDDIMTFKDGYENIFGAISLVFSDYMNRSDALAHCAGHLDADGCVIKSYVGALDRADRGARGAAALLIKLQQNPPNP